MKSILIIDDDTKLNSLLNEYLSRNGFKSASVENAKDAYVKLRNFHFDLIILDLMMPEVDGLDACKEIRRTYSTPIIMLTARGDVTDKIIGLELGADDYLAKPFEPRELLARIQAILRRNEMMQKKNAVLKFSLSGNELVIDGNMRTAFLKNKNLDLTTAEFELLLLFAKHNGKVLSRDEIMQNTKGISWMSFDRSVDVMVSRLRNKLKLKNYKEQVIKTVHSVGYMFYADDKN